jgi:glycosyltransferase involved in cell wall biosynthesis
LLWRPDRLFGRPHCAMNRMGSSGYKAQMQDNHALVSIAMPVRNCRDTLPQAVGSIQWQTYPHWELLVIDDGSQDGTNEVARNYTVDGRIRVFSDGRHLGISYRLNQAIALSRGRLFARMDGDDVSYPERLERQVEYLNSHPEVDLVGTGAIVFGNDGVAIGKRFAPELHDEICAHPHGGIPITHPTFMGRLEFFRENGYAIESVLSADRYSFSVTFPSGLRSVRGGMMSSEDQDLLLRSYKCARFGNSPELLLGYREASLKIRKQWVMRYYVIKSLYYTLWPEGSYLAFLRFASIVLLKFSVDMLAISTGLNYRLLGHRARPITLGERNRWDSLWGALKVISQLGPTERRLEK